MGDVQIWRKEKIPGLSRENNHGLVCFVVVIKFVPFCALMYLAENKQFHSSWCGYGRFNFGYLG